MEVVLLKDVKNVGKQWDVCNVAPGFARNVLIPNKDAAAATPAMLARAEQMRSREEGRSKQVATKRNERAGELNGAAITTTAKANAKGDLYAAVSAKDIVKAIRQQQGVTVSPKAIVIEKPIKQLGAHRLIARLRGGEKAQFQVIVEEDN